MLSTIMKSNKINRIAFFCLMVVVTIVSACEEGPNFREFEYPAPIVEDFNPKTGRPGTEISIIGKDFGELAGAAEIMFNGVIAENIISYSDGEIVVVVPEAAVTGAITVKVWGHERMTSEDFNFIPGAKIQSFSAERGKVGDVITIVGANFGTDINAVSVLIGEVEAEIVSVSSNEIQFKVPETDSGKITLDIEGQEIEGPLFLIGDELTPIAHYLFESNTESAVGNYHGTGVGTASYGEGIDGEGIVLGGSNHVLLPENITSIMESYTIAVWVKPDALDNWSRVFDFGNGTSKYMFLTPRNGSSKTVRYAIKNGGGEQVINTDVTLVTGEWVHLAVSYSKETSTGVLYVNGEEAGRNEDMTIMPIDLGATPQNYIGKSQWPDPLFKGVVDDFRIYTYGLPSNEIQNIYQLVDGSTPEGKYTFEFDDPDANAWLPLQDATWVVENGQLKVTYSQAAPTKRRADLKYDLGNQGSYVYSSEYPIMAMKMTNKPAEGNLRWDFPDLGSFGNNDYKKDFEAQDVIYWDFSEKTSESRVETNWVVQLKIADVTSDETGYEIDWIRTFKSKEELEAFINN